MKVLFLYLSYWPQVLQDYPPNLSILVSGGTKTKLNSPSNGEWSAYSPTTKSFFNWIVAFFPPLCVGFWNLLEMSSGSGDTPYLRSSTCGEGRWVKLFGITAPMGDGFHPRLNTGGSPIVHKYREGKMQSHAKAQSKSTWRCRDENKGYPIGRRFYGLLVPSQATIARSCCSQLPNVVSYRKLLWIDWLYIFSRLETRTKESSSCASWRTLVCWHNVGV